MHAIVLRHGLIDAVRDCRNRVRATRKEGVAQASMVRQRSRYLQRETVAELDGEHGSGGVPVHGWNYSQGRWPSIRSSSSHSEDPLRKPDVVIVTDHGDVVVVEVKRLVNPELRDGRRAIAQGVEYASLLSSVSEAELVRSLTKGKHSSWDLLCRHDLGHGAASPLANVLRNRIRDGDVHLVIACEEAPPDLADLVRAAANSSRLAFALHVVEVRPMVPEGASEAAGHPIAWVPWPRLDTEIVHRTAVTVRVEGADGDQAPKVVLDVQDDSASEVEERIANSSRSARRRERELILQRVLSPLAENLDLTSEQLWNELGGLHRAVELEDWSYLMEAIAHPDDEGPNQRRGNVGWGRYGVNLLSRWEPSVFVGAYLRDHNHGQSLLAPDGGGDFALIVDIKAKAHERADFANHPCFQALRKRLKGDAGSWDFADHHAQPKKNSYHPLHLRRPLRDIIGDTDTLEERKARWLEAAHDAVKTLLEGGELAELRRQQRRQ